jgi:hypothetical protein
LELARGLALWAAAFKTLPGLPQLRGSRSLTAAIAELPRPDPPWTMLEAGTFTRIDELQEFPAVVESLGSAESAHDALRQLTATFCDVLVSNPDTPALPLVHTVTPASALRTLLPHLPGLSVGAVYAQLWHVNAAITAAFVPVGGSAKRTSVVPASEVPTTSDLIADAVEHRDSHVLKFTEACVREHAASPDHVYLHAARHVLDQIASW